jgi:uncharacterized membrane protein YphA (DoxX/SURF4 family)
MHTLLRELDVLDLGITRFLARHSLMLLRVGMGAVFLWFGALKFFPGLSPAQELATRTIDVLTLGLVPGAVSVVLLAALECAIGLGLLTGRFLRLTLLLLAFQMMGTLTPLFLFPGEVFVGSVLVPTLEGQYILKNAVLIGAGAVIGATARGGRLVAEPLEDGNGRHLRRAS